MPSTLQDRIKRLMEDQEEEAPLPISYSTLRIRDEAPDPPGEPEGATPSPSDELPPIDRHDPPEDFEPPQEDRPEVETIETPQEDQPEAEMIEPGELEQEQNRPEPEWEEMLQNFEPAEPREEQPDPYLQAMADSDWKMALQDRSNILT